MTINRCVFILLAAVINQAAYIRGQASPPISLALTSAVDATNGGTVCPNVEVEFTCVGQRTSFLLWQRNGRPIDTIQQFSPSSRRVDNFTVFVDAISLNDTSQTLNFTSRLVFSLRDVRSGNSIACADSAGNNMSSTLNYVIRTAPGMLQDTDYNVTLVSRSVFTITWNPAFTSLHDVTQYNIHSATPICLSPCSPSEPCQCTASAEGEPIRFNISATNCGDQEGPAAPVQAQPHVPAEPMMCSGVPVYNYVSNLMAVDFWWMRVDNPPEFTPGVHQDVSGYNVRAGNTNEIIPATTACSSVNCSYRLPLTLPLLSDMITTSVSAENIFGFGASCSAVETPISSQNQDFTLLLSTTNPNNQSVTCTPRTLRSSGFDCQFCYSPMTSCQGSFTSCPVIQGSTLNLTLIELTYCYRATATINGTTLAVIEGNFNTACLPQMLVPGQPENLTSNRLSIAGGSVTYRGTVEGDVATYQCDSGYSLSGNVERVCQSDGNWNGTVPSCIRNSIPTANIILLVFSLVLWILSLIIVIAETVLVILVLLSKCKSVSLPRWWHKAIYIVLVIATVALLVTVLILWIVFGTAVGSSSSVSRRDSSVIVAFIFSILALIFVSSVVVFIVVIKKCYTASVKPINHHDQPQDPGMIKKPLGEELYAQPNGQKTSDSAVEEDEHIHGPGNPPKKKHAKVRIPKKAQQRKNKNQETEAEYNTLMGEGRHIGTLTGKDDAPLATPERGQYGKLEGREHYTEPFDTIKEHYEMSEYPSVSNNKNKNQGPEYAVVDKKSKRKK